MNKKKGNKIAFIIVASILAVLWVASLVFLAFAVYSADITSAIQNAYAKVFKDKTLNLFKVTLWSTMITTVLLVGTLLFDEVKRKYVK